MLKYEAHSEQEWMQIISEYKTSGLSNVKFIAVNHLEKNKFYDMKKKYEKRNESAIPIDFIEVVPEVKATAPIKINKNGFEIEFTKDVDKALLKELLGVMNDI